MHTPVHDTCIRLEVLPLEASAEDERVRLFCDGLVMDLITDLARFRSFQVIAYDTTRRMRPDEQADGERLRGLDLDYLVRGLARYRDGQLTVNLQLLHVPGKRVVWTKRFGGRLEELSLMQEDMAENIVGSLQSEVDADVLHALRHKPLTGLGAYECWLRGFQELKLATAEGNERARGYFRQAMERDPQYARACTGMSLSYFNEWSCQLWSRWDVSRNGAREWAERALALDGRDHVSHAILGRVLLFGGDYEKAELYLRNSLRINPNDSETLLLVAFGLVYLGHAEEARQLHERARRLQPDRGFGLAACASFIHFELGNDDEAIAQGTLREAGRGWVDFSAFLAAAHFHRGEMEEMQRCWDDFLAEFSEKINGGTRADTSTALRWMMDVNPYRGATRLAPFWEYLASRNTDPVDDARETGTLHAHDDGGRQRMSSGAALFRREGQLWRVVFDGMECMLPDLKGCGDIARLLSEPRRDIHCTELMGARTIERGAEVIDRTARREYEARIRVLREDIEEAESLGHEKRLAALHEEYDALLQQLAGAVGKGGRTRNVSSTVEKCRSSVTWRIRKAIKDIDRQHPALARHLERSIRTGLFCRYSPEHDHHWRT